MFETIFQNKMTKTKK